MECCLGLSAEMSPVSAPFRIDWGHTQSWWAYWLPVAGLMFIGATMDQLFRAFDVKDGRVVELPAASGRYSYADDLYLLPGRQYLVINAGGHAMFNRPTGIICMHLRCRSRFT